MRVCAFIQCVRDACMNTCICHSLIVLGQNVGHNSIVTLTYYTLINFLHSRSVHKVQKE